MPFIHAYLDAKGDVRPCCSWDIEVDDDSDPWPNIKDGLHNAVNDIKFEEVRDKVLRGVDVDGCRKCHHHERNEGFSFRIRRLLEDKEYIANTNFNKNYHSLRYLETGFSSLCNLSCRMCWSGVSSTFHRITKPGQRVVGSYDWSVDEYDCDLSNLTHLKFVGGEPLMEQKHDIFIERLLNEHKDLSQLHILYHTNCTKLPSKQVQELWKRCRKIELSMSIDGYKDTNWIQRPGPYTWQDIVAVTDQFKAWSEEWGNMELRVGACLTKLNVFKMHELIDWTKTYFRNTKGWIGLGFDVAERPREISIQDWNKDPVRVAQVTEYANTLAEPYKSQAISGLHFIPAEGDIETFKYEQSKLNDYWGYKIDAYL